MEIKQLKVGDQIYYPHIVSNLFKDVIDTKVRTFNIVGKIHYQIEGVISPVYEQLKADNVGQELLKHNQSSSTLFVLKEEDRVHVREVPEQKIHDEYYTTYKEAHSALLLKRLTK